MQQAMMQQQMMMQQVPQQSMYQSPQMMQPMGMPMQSPWVMYYNQHGQPYYYNEQTGEQVWQLPPGATCSRQGGTYPMNMGQNMGWGQQMPYGYQQSWY